MPQRQARTRVVCRHCNAENNDPGGPLAGWSCWNCGYPGQLQRIAIPEKDPAMPVLTGSIGAMIGASVAGPPGALGGALLGWLAGLAVQR